MELLYTKYSVKIRVNKFLVLLNILELTILSIKGLKVKVSCRFNHKLNYIHFHIMCKYIFQILRR